MELFDDLKKTWKGQQAVASGAYDPVSFAKMIKLRVRKQTDRAMQYFWSAFTLQLILYGLLGHVIIVHWHDGKLFIISLLGVLLQVPFTYMLMKKFKAMAVTRPIDNSSSSLYQYVKRRHHLLQEFYLFKRSYERFLVPLSTILGCYLVFELYLPGELLAYWNTIWVLIVITILSCAVVIMQENKKNFEEPLGQYKAILDEFEMDTKQV